MLTGRPVKTPGTARRRCRVGAPRGAERWYLKDGVMADGRHRGAQVHRLLRQRRVTPGCRPTPIIKGVGHLPGPYTIPNVHADVYCVYTNRTPATAMRGFGITGVDFAIEAHMDKVAEAVGMNPIELRILNAYRDGDMKAHRREAKNCALIECAQVVAEKAGVRISETARAAASTRGGGGERGRLPAHTATDETGRVTGFESGSYARKGSAPRASPGAPAPGAPAQPRPAPNPPAASRPEPAPPRSAPPPPEPPKPDAPKPSPARTGALRFSSLSGFRRR